MIMCILALVLNENVHNCVGFEKPCDKLRRFWKTLFMIASVLGEDVHTCVGFGKLCDHCVGVGRRCAYLRRF